MYEKGQHKSDHIWNQLQYFEGLDLLDWGSDLH